MIIIIAEPGKKVHLGRIGENEARAVQFDISQTQAEFPGASFSVLNMRPQDPDAYPVNGQFIRIEGSSLYWTLQSGDLTEDGLGECELKATVDGVIVKSEIWTTEICPALDGNGTPPEPWESWQQQVEDDADRAEAAAELLEHPGAEAETLPAGSQATAGYADGVFTFGIPKGDTGEDGYSPTVRMMRGSGRLNIYITDKNGTKSSYVDDGKDGRKLAMGSVHTLETGEPATAEIIDNPQWPEMYLNLGLPKGNTGDQGEQGETGETPIISIGTVTTLPAGSSATASMDTTDPEHPVLNMGIPKGDPGEVTEAELAAVETELKSAIDQKAAIITDTVQNVAIASVPDAANNLPLTALRFAVNPIQAGSGDPSPQNVRSISGRSQAVVSQSKKNLFNPNSTAIEWVETNRTLSTRADAKSVRVRCSAGDAFTLSQKTASSTSNVMLIAFLDGNDNVLTRNVKANGDTSLTVTAPAEAKVCLASFVLWSATEEQQLEIGSTASSYTAYTGTTATVQFGSTVYGGEVDWVRGVLTVTHMKYVCDSVSSTATASTGVRYGQAGLSIPTLSESNLTDSNCKSSTYKFRKTTAPSDSGWFRINATVTMYIFDDRFTDKATANAILAEEKPEFWYPLATPVTIPLSNLDIIKTAQTAGVNNFWADSGDIVEMTYPCDTKGYVEKRLSASQTLMELIVTANRESEMKASKAYSSGNLLIVNGTLYKATTSIANGATLTPGTNVTATTVAAELAALA